MCAQTRIADCPRARGGLDAGNWKTAQTLVEVAGGVASEVAHIVTELRAAGLQQPLACTRKAFPVPVPCLTRPCKQGAASFTGWVYRMGCCSIREHRVLDASVDDMVGRLRKAQPERKMVSLVTTLEEAMTFAVAGSDILQLMASRLRLCAAKPSWLCTAAASALPPWPCPAG